MQTDEVQGARPTRRARAWIKRYMPDDVNRVLRDYDAGMNAEAIQEVHGVSKATLYRWIAQYHDQKTVDNDPTCMRMRIATLEKTVLVLSERLAEASGDAPGAAPPTPPTPSEVSHATPTS